MSANSCAIHRNQEILEVSSVYSVCVYVRDHVPVCRHITCTYIHVIHFTASQINDSQCFSVKYMTATVQQN